VEAAVLRHYGSLLLPAGFADAIRRKLDETLADEERGARLLRGQLSARLSALNSKEENLLDLAADGTLVTAKVRERLRAIAGEREQLQAELERGDDQLQSGAAVIRQALELLENPQELYRQAGPTVRRALNQAFFDKLDIDGPSVTEEELAEPFDAILFQRARPTYS
jgi:hypothetical protein